MILKLASSPGRIYNDDRDKMQMPLVTETATDWLFHHNKWSSYLSTPGW